MRRLTHPATADLDLTVILHALGDPVRLEIVRRLRTQPDVTCVPAGMDIPKSTLSNHWRVLREAGLTSTTVDGRQRRMRLRAADVDSRFPGLLDALTDHDTPTDHDARTDRDTPTDRTALTGQDAMDRLLAGAGDGHWGELTALFAPDAVVEFPLADPAGPLPRRLRGCVEIADRLRDLSELGLKIAARDARMQVADGGGVVTECTLLGRLPAGPAWPPLPAALVIDFRDGLVAAVRSYLPGGLPTPEVTVGPASRPTEPVPTSASAPTSAINDLLH
ncbi:helix-turn-helix domain-containing protein [Candidatus Frankia alpina]|uniref:helix-turn-helix domain-containing protein n=1 Tax=Candidatus Frankia alpina TaxID=2699483 RepID=UPI0013D2A2C2|nr:helix-turn-helix domain-containing protein [Candidatus Frankia alpina]